jgi:hypothetical protein
MVRKKVYVIGDRIVTGEYLAELEAKDENLTEEEREDKHGIWCDLHQALWADWQAEVDAGKTELSYDDWFAIQFDK